MDPSKDKRIFPFFHFKEQSNANPNPAPQPPADTRTEEQKKADYGLSLQMYGEEKMNNFVFKEASDYMIAAADVYLNIAKTSKDPALVNSMKERLPPLLHRVSLNSLIHLD